jgi:molybdate transport system substrate-binding protein
MRTGITAGIATAAILVASGIAHADELQLLTAASLQTVFKEIIGDFEGRSGHRVSLRYSTTGAITERMNAGEQADLVVSSPASISALVASGKLAAGSEMTTAKTGIGIIVSAGSPKPRIESVADFRRALLEARVIVYANPAGGGAAGIHIARLIQRLRLSGRLKAKTKFGAGGDVAEVTLAEGQGALGLTQVSEIVGKPGAQFIPVPDTLQNYTGFVAATPVGAKESPAVKAFIRFLKTPEATAVMRDKGMQVN